MVAQIPKPPCFSSLFGNAKPAAEKMSYSVILSEAKNLSSI
jgi:hypothetical protein